MDIFTMFFFHTILEREQDSVIPTWIAHSRAIGFAQMPDTEKAPVELKPAILNVLSSIELLQQCGHNKNCLQQ